MQLASLPTHYELRDDPDDVPRIYPTCAAAERAGRKISARRGSPILLYEVTPERETYLGEV